MYPLSGRVFGFTDFGPYSWTILYNISGFRVHFMNERPVGFMNGSSIYVCMYIFIVSIIIPLGPCFKTKS